MISKPLKTLSSLGRFWMLARDRWTLSKTSKNDALGKVSPSSIQLPTHLRRSVGWIRGAPAYLKTVHWGSSDRRDIWEASGPSWAQTPIKLGQALCELSRPETVFSNAMQRQWNTAGNGGITGVLRSDIKHHRLLCEGQSLWNKQKGFTVNLHHNSVKLSICVCRTIWL